MLELGVNLSKHDRVHQGLHFTWVIFRRRSMRIGWDGIRILRLAWQRDFRLQVHKCVGGCGGVQTEYVCMHACT